MQFPNKLKTSVAAGKKRHLALDSLHMTTQDFGLLRPVYYRELNPGEKIKVNASCFCRLTPMVFPTIGRVVVEQRAFFVPYREILDSWEDFISNKQSHYDSGQGALVVPQVMTVSNLNIVKMFVSTSGSSYVYGLCSAGSSSDYDICNLGQNGSLTYHKLTPKGKNYLAVLHSLGYSINWASKSDVDTTVFSAMPILALLKIYIDWYVNPNYDWSDFTKYFKANGYALTPNNLNEILNFVLYANYSPDYFVCAQTNQLSNGAILDNQKAIPDTTTTDGVVTSNNESVFVLGNGVEQLTNFGISLVQRLADFLKRNSIAGSRYVDQMLVRFGAKPSDLVAHRSVYCGSAFTDVLVKDNMQNAPDGDATSDNPSKGVGSYVGKGIGNGGSTFGYETKGDAEHGIFMVLSVVRPRTMYYQGRDRMLQHTDVLDFWTPEFDGVNMQAIRQDELVTLDGKQIQEITTSAATYNPSSVFGFTPRYAEYKVSRDFLSGDFRVKRYENSMRPFHLFRELPAAAGLWKAGFAFGQMNQTDRLNYDRIFQTVGTDEVTPDHFICSYAFNVSLETSILPISESLLPEEGNKEVEMRPFGLYF